MEESWSLISITDAVGAEKENACRESSGLDVLPVECSKAISDTNLSKLYFVKNPMQNHASVWSQDTKSSVLDTQNAKRG